MTHITVIGGGLAGVEAAWQAAQHGVRVTLAEMRPQQGTPAHKTGLLAELVCSNSLGGMSHGAGSGLLKEELRRLGLEFIAGFPLVGRGGRGDQRKETGHSDKKTRER